MSMTFRYFLEHLLPWKLHKSFYDFAFACDAHTHVYINKWILFYLVSWQNILTNFVATRNAIFATQHAICDWASFYEICLPYSGRFSLDYHKKNKNLIFLISFLNILIAAEKRLKFKFNNMNFTPLNRWSRPLCRLAPTATTTAITVAAASAMTTRHSWFGYGIRQAPAKL